MFVEELSNYDDMSAVRDMIDGNYYMPKEVGMNYPFVQFAQCTIFLAFIILALSLISNYKQDHSEHVDLPLKRIICSLTIL